MSAALPIAGYAPVVRVRPATPAEAGRVAELINSAFAIERFFVDGDRIGEAEVRDMLGRGSFLVAEAEGALVGCVYVEVRGERGYFGLLAVQPGRQRGGLGRHLVALAEKHCRDAGCSVMDMQFVNLRTELPAYYGAMGYAESGTAPWPPESVSRLHQPAWFVRMSKPL